MLIKMIEFVRDLLVSILDAVYDIVLWTVFAVLSVFTIVYDVLMAVFEFDLSKIKEYVTDDMTYYWHELYPTI